MNREQTTEDDKEMPLFKPAYRAYARSLKVGEGGARLAKVGDQGFFPFYCNLKTTCFVKKWGAMAPPPAPGGVGPGWRRCYSKDSSQ